MRARPGLLLSSPLRTVSLILVLLGAISAPHAHAQGDPCAAICAEFEHFARNVFGPPGTRDRLYQLDAACRQCRAGGGGGDQSVVWCPNGAYCQPGQTCCGNMCCGSGSYCSRSGCIPQGASECGNGQWCNEGTQCWRMPRDYPDRHAGTIRCVTAEQQAELENWYAQHKEALREAERAKREAARKKEEERKEAARRKLEEQKQAARRAEEAKQAAIRKKEQERQAAELKRKQEQDAANRKKVSDMLLQNLEKQRQADLQKTAQQRQRELQAFMAEYGPRSTNCRLVEMAYGADQGKACALKELSANPPPAATAAPLLPPSISAKQLEYLKQNAVSLQPEPRKIGAPQAPAPAVPGRPLSTFVCGTPPNQYPCPVTIGRPQPQEQKPALTEAEKQELERKQLGPFAPLTEEEKRAARERQAAEDAKRSREETERLIQFRQVAVETCSGALSLFGRCTYFSGAGPASVGTPGWGKLCRTCTKSGHCKSGVFGDKCTWNQEQCEDACKPSSYDPPRGEVQIFPPR